MLYVSQTHTPFDQPVEFAFDLFGLDNDPIPSHSCGVGVCRSGNYEQTVSQCSHDRTIRNCWIHCTRYARSLDHHLPMVGCSQSIDVWGYGIILLEMLICKVVYFRLFRPDSLTNLILDHIAPYRRRLRTSTGHLPFVIHDDIDKDGLLTCFTWFVTAVSSTLYRL